MPNAKSNRIWYVYTCDARTNAIIFSELEPSPCYGYQVEDIDHKGRKFEKKTNLARVNSYEQIKMLRKSYKDINLCFQIFVQDSPGGKIYRWPFDKGLRGINKKR